MELSVVIPAYRSAELIGRTIASVLAEGVAPGNVIVVEDGVFDRTAEVVRSHAGVRLISLQQNRGAPHARNTGLRQVSTRYVMFLDADDYVENGLLRGLVQALDEGAADVAMGPWRYDGEGFEDAPLRVPQPQDTAGWIAAWTQMRFFPPCCVAWNADSLRRIGGWDEQLKKNQDGELMIRAFLSGLKVAVSGEGNGVYWQHGSPHRVTNARIDDFLHATGVIYSQLQAWADSQAGNLSGRDRQMLGRYCCVTAWHAFAHDRNRHGIEWLERARACGFRSKGYNGKTAALANLLGIRLSSKIRFGLERAGISHKINTWRRRAGNAAALARPVAGRADAGPRAAGS
jgi:glycosyltransferase involved in cell wall biosynthesis